jgi:hypothetical protein
VSEPATRQPIALRVLAAWPALTPLVAFVIAETVQLVQHGADGFPRATFSCRCS